MEWNIRLHRFKDSNMISRMLNMRKIRDAKTSSLSFVFVIVRVLKTFVLHTSVFPSAEVSFIVLTLAAWCPYFKCANCLMGISRDVWVAVDAGVILSGIWWPYSRALLDGHPLIFLLFSFTYLPCKSYSTAKETRSFSAHGSVRGSHDTESSAEIWQLLAFDQSILAH